MIPLLLLTLAWPAGQDTLADRGTPQADVEFRLRGNRTLGARPLLAEIEFWLADLRADPGSAAALEDGAFALEGLYRRAGFPDVQVSGRSERLGDAWRITFRVEEGARRLVGELRIRGNDSFTADRLQEIFDWEHEGFLGAGAAVFSRKALEDGLSGVRLLYRLEGFLEAEVSAGTAEREEDPGRTRRVDVTVTVKEGERTLVGRVEVARERESAPDEGVRAARREPAAGSAPAVTDEQIHAAAGVEPGAPFTPRVPIEVSGRVRTLFAERGFLEARVEVEVLPGDRRGRTLRIKVVEGPRCRIAAVELRGNEHTRAGWIRRRLRVRVGDLYRQSAFVESRRALLGTGLFRGVRITAEPLPGDRTLLKVTVEVEEKERIRLSFRGGFGSYELGRAGVEILHRNFLGFGLEGRLSGKVSFRGEEAEAEIRYPFFLEQRLTVGLSGRALRFEEVSFVRQELSTAFELEAPLPERIHLAGGYELREEKILEVDATVPPELRKDLLSSLLFMRGRRDTRDSHVDPQRGTRASARAEYAIAALGSTLGFVSLRGDYTAIWSPWPRWTLVAATRGGVVNSLEAREVPLGERFFLGGSRSVRSFTQDDLGPKDPFGDPIGGEAFLLGSGELRFPLPKPLGGAIFFDTGTLTEHIEDFAAGRYRHAVGIGLFLRTPIGPLRTDFAFNPDRDPGEDEWVAHVRLGHPF